MDSGGMAPVGAAEVGTNDSIMVDELPKQISEKKIVDDKVQVLACIILLLGPSSFTGGPRNMRRKYIDSMTVSAKIRK
nr:shaggy-related protein kinase epsilon isoform X1 [Tanacetum cinerariifolium]